MKALFLYLKKYIGTSFYYDKIGDIAKQYTYTVSYKWGKNSFKFVFMD